MSHFNIRVYGLLIHDGAILAVEEPVGDTRILKFPGGGVEFGEGLIDGLKREFREELHCAIKDVRHFYTTDFFVQSFLNPAHQVISVYYTVQADVRKMQLDGDDRLLFRWIPMDELHEDMFALPIDKVVVQMLHADGAGSLDAYHYFPL